MNLSSVKKQHPDFLTKEIFVHKNGRNFYYIDPRTKPVEYGETPLVKPIAWNWMYLWIVCPFCQRIHQYAVIDVKRENNIIYGNCQGRINNGIDHSPIKIDTSEMICKRK